MQKIAIIMRGISGSGKSTVAKMISEAFNGSVHSTDSYFIGESGVYSFDPKKLGENHTLNQQAFKNSISTGVPVVICDNTNVKNWEMEAYVKVAKDAGYWIVYMTMPHPDPKVAVKRNSHGVPEFAINKMIENWEPIEQSAIVDKTPSIIYTGLFVENNEELLKIFVPKHENVFGHHSTIAFKPNSLDGIEVGRKRNLKVIGRIHDDKGDALLVDNNQSSNPLSHITLSCADGVKPFYSSTLLKNKEKISYFPEPIDIEVVEGYFNGKEIVMH